MAVSVRARFIEPMLLLRTDRLPDGVQWMYEVLCGPPHNSSSVAFDIMWR